MLLNYFKTTLKVLMRRKFFTFASLFGIAFTLVILLTVTSMADQFVRPGGPEHESYRQLDVEKLTMWSKDRNSIAVSSPGYKFLHENVRPLTTPENMTFYTGANATTSFQLGERIELDRRYTDAAYWEIFDFDFLEGSAYTASDDENGNVVAVISRRVRDMFFPKGPAVGREFELSGRPVRVIGVVENVSGMLTRARGDVWMPLGATISSGYKDSFRGAFSATLQYRSSGDFDAGKKEFASMLPNVVTPDPDFWGEVLVVPMTRLEAVSAEMGNSIDGEQPKIGSFVGKVLAALFVFMLLPTINLINLNVSRIIERSSEIGVRKSFGASSRELIGQFLFENILLTAIGGVLGILGAFGVMRILSDSGVIPFASFALNWRVFFATITIIGFFGLLSGVYPAWRMSRLHPVDALRGKV